MNVYQKDLNLLMIFHILYQERNATRASERLTLSQPALSHKLNKLRYEFDDPLFVKAPRGLTPTPKAHAIAPEIRRLMNGLEQFYSELDTEDFLSRKDKVYIYSTDYMEQKLFARLIPHVQKHAPQLTLVTHNTGSKLPRAELENGQCDIAIAGFYTQLPDTFRQQKVASEKFAVLANRNHSRIGQELDLETYLSCQHIVTTLTGDLHGNVDRGLEKLGLRRQVVAGVSSFLSPARIIRHSDLIVTCLASLAKEAAQLDDGLEIYPVPFELPGVDIFQFWHERTHADPLRRWLREQIRAFLSD
ncbi:LysR family transcriptional regulator [Photobacterium halotolerans]|uniref:LysR family transcriptional regulator n=2 Tax=Photobacterium halotolerans TaxID=265726 RepID=A0A0F5VGH1_9GAMM|nr:LysR family transcriptional regulator [Photobacterium halotolerans]